MAVERRLTELAGPVGGRLHTARSRNDQVATDVALFTREARSPVSRRSARSWPRSSTPPSATSTGRCPATRTCSAPSRSISATTCWPTCGCSSAIARAALRRRADGGAAARRGALAGVNFDTDRGAVAAELGFERVAPNSIDAVSNRDFVLDYLGAAATCATHLSRLGAELVLWSSEEFGFVELPDAWTSGSSIMPQKKNPDAAELLRAKAPRIVAHLGALHGVMHALPLTYNKDLQEDKEHLFDAVDTLGLCLAAASGHGRRRALPPRADGRRGGRRADRGDRPRRPAGQARRRRSARPTASSRGSCARR